MKATQTFVSTLKEAPADAEVVSHQLMIRAGMIRKLASGIYTWAPLGLRVLRKVEAIVREEMNRAGAIEMLMPSMAPFRILICKSLKGMLRSLKLRERCRGIGARETFSPGGKVVTISNSGGGGSISVKS